MTQPLFRSIALQGGGRFFHIDNGPFPNDRIDPGEGVSGVLRGSRLEHSMIPEAEAGRIGELLDRAIDEDLGGRRRLYFKRPLFPG